jgi:hypothetical protein
MLLFIVARILPDTPSTIKIRKKERKKGKEGIKS